MRSGKQFVSKRAGLPEVNFATPLKALTHAAMPLTSFSKEDLRPYYQYVGQIGRGRVDDRHPLNPWADAGRLSLMMLARNFGHELTGVADADAWKHFGCRDDFWICLFLNRKESAYPCAVQDCRFPNELEALNEDGFVHVHVMCSEESRLDRLGRKYDVEIDENISERFAIEIDAMVTGNSEQYHVFMTEENFCEYRPSCVVWSDDRHAPPPELDCISPAELVNHLSREQ